ncbi:MAG: hypothetical protein AAB507_01390 [Patescibacteria group bacterium]
MARLLKVGGVKTEDIYKDIVRVSAANRKNDCDRDIVEGSVCKVVVASNQKERYAILRGNKGSDTEIKIDEYLRNKLGIEKGKEYEFTFKTRWWYQFCWPWSATDPGYRISSQIAVISFLLGLLSILLVVVL